MKSIVSEAFYSLGGTFKTIGKNIGHLYKLISGKIIKVTGINLSINNTERAKMKFQLKGNTSQDGTPTPANPIEVNVVTGNNTIITSNKNLCYKAELQGTQNIRFYFRKVSQKNIVCSFTVNEALNNNSLYLIVDGTGYGIISFLTVEANTKAIATITLTDAQIAAIQGGTEMWFLLYKSGANFVVPDDIQIEVGTSATEYVEHKEIVNEINLGKNLAEITGENHSGSVSVTQNNNEFQLTWTGGFNVYLQNIASNLDSSKTYTISFKHKGESLDLRNGSATVQTIRTGTHTDYTLCSATITNITKFEFHFIRSSGTIDTAYIKDFQIEKGSVATEYSKYFTPIELGKIGDYQNKIYKTSGKNIFDMATAVQSSYGYHSNTGTLTHIDNNTIKIVKGITSSDHRLTIANNVNISSGTTINISWKYASGNGNVIAQIQALDKDNNIINLTSLNNNGLTSPQQITLSTDITYIWLGTAWNNNSDLVISNIMINKGITATEYEPYGSGKWYLHKETKKIVLDGTQSSSSVNTSSTNTTRVQYNHYADGVATTLNGYCNQLTFVRNWGNDIEGVCYDPSNGGFWIRINKATIGTTASEVNTYLSNNNLICYIPLATPIDTEITNTELVEQLEALNNSYSYKGQTNISQVNDDLPFNLDIEIVVNE